MIFYLVYVLTPDGRKHDFARTPDADSAAKVVTIIEHAFMVCDAPGEVKIARCVEVDKDE